jgi:hypothetical protein
MRATPRQGHSPIAMRLRATGEPLEQPGDFKWRTTDAGERILVIAIPTPSARTGWFACDWTIDHKNHCGAQWSWDGNETAPTLTPSLHWVGVWHGWCRAGQLVEA